MIFGVASTVIFFPCPFAIGLRWGAFTFSLRGFTSPTTVLCSGSRVLRLLARMAIGNASHGRRAAALLAAFALTLLVLFGFLGGGGAVVSVPSWDAIGSGLGLSAAGSDDVVGGGGVVGADGRHLEPDSIFEGRRGTAASAPPAVSGSSTSTAAAFATLPSQEALRAATAKATADEEKEEPHATNSESKDDGESAADATAAPSVVADSAATPVTESDAAPRGGSGGQSVLVEAEGDVAGHGPRHALLRMLMAVALEEDSVTAPLNADSSASSIVGAKARGFLEPPEWRSLRLNTHPNNEATGAGRAVSRWRIAYNRSQSRPVPSEYSSASAAADGFFSAIWARGVVPDVVNSSVLVDGPLEGPRSIRLAALRGMPPLDGANAAEDASEAKDMYFDAVEEEAEEGRRFDAIANANAFAKTLDDLEFVRSVPAVHAWLRPLNETVARWAARDESAYQQQWNATFSETELNAGGGGRYRPPPPRPQRSRSAVRVACLYAGFVRDFFRMYISCMDKTRSARKCRDRYVNKLYGSQRENIVDASGCDVFSSTWDIVGTGRYDVKDYKMDVKISTELLHKVYGARLGGLHVQQYSAYERVWKLMATRARSFPQTRPTHSEKLPSTWRGVPENNFIFRVNDYSQSYKHWCVVQLALLSGYSYDVFFRLRMDLRAVRSISNFRFATIVSTSEDSADEAAAKAERSAAAEGERRALLAEGKGGEATVPMAQRVIAFDVSNFKEEGGAVAGGSNGGVLRLTHYLTPSTMHVQNFDYADFGFMASPSLIHSLAAVWYYCLMPPVRGLPLQHLAPHLRPASEVISEYNLVVWRIIWENRMQIDNGGIVLRISRRAEVKGGGGRPRRRR